MAQPAKRRIQPQLISPSQTLPTASNLAVPSDEVGNNILSPAAQPSQPSSSRFKSQHIPEPKEDAEIAIKLGMKGRRIYVPITMDSQEVDYRKLLKAQGITHPLQVPQINEPSMPGHSQIQKHGKGVMPLAAVIARLERQYVLRDEDESSSGDGSQGASQDQPEHSGDESGAEKGEAEKIGEYWMEDDFIDDDEFANFIESDHRRSKHQGFFINKGEIEKVDEQNPLAEAEARPKKKKQKATAPEAGNNKDNTQPGAKKKKKRRLDSPAKLPKEAKAAKDQAAVEPDGETEGVSALAALAGKAASQANAAAPTDKAQPEHSAPQVAPQAPAAQTNGTVTHSAQQIVPPQMQSQHVPQLSADMKRALEDLQELVEPLKIEEAQNPTTTKTIPKKLNPRLSNFACLLARESATNLAIKNHVLDQVTRMFEPLYTRSKLAKRLESLAKSAAEDLSNAVGKIKEHIAIKLETLKVRQEHQDIAAAEPRDGFLWDKYVEHFILTYRNLFKKVYGDHRSDEAIMTTLLDLWPKGQMSLEELMEALSRAIDNPRPSTRGPRKSLEGTEAPSADRVHAAAATASTAAANAPLNAVDEAGRASETATQPVDQAPNGRPTAASATANAVPAAPAPNANDALRPSSANTRPSHAAPTSSPLPALVHVEEGQATDEALLRAAKALGADDHLLVESIQEAKNVRSNITTMVLMTAGAQGFTAQEIVDRANALGLTVKDNGPWDKSMRRNAATAVRNSKHLVNIGSSRYAHIAFQGVSEKAAIEAEAKRKSKAESLASKAQGMSRGPSVDLEAG